GGRVGGERADGVGGGGEEVAAAVPVPGRLRVHEPEVGLVHQGGGLERLAGLLPGQAMGRQLAQLLIDQRQELLRRVRVALLDGPQDARHLAHPCALFQLDRGSSDRILPGRPPHQSRPGRPPGLLLPAPPDFAILGRPHSTGLTPRTTLPCVSASTCCSGPRTSPPTSSRCSVSSRRPATTASKSHSSRATPPTTSPSARPSTTTA